MRKLESVIAQFVGDLLQTIGDATVDDLRDLFAGRPESEKLADQAILALPLPAPSTESSRSPRGTVRGLERAGNARSRRSMTTYSSMLAPTTGGTSPPPGVAEITDPESLLSLGSLGGRTATDASNGLIANGAAVSGGAMAHHAAPSARPRRASRASRAQGLLDFSSRSAPLDAPSDSEGESPASGVRPIGLFSTVRLSDNETLARVSNSGVVIRRKKRA